MRAGSPWPRSRMRPISACSACAMARGTRPSAASAMRSWAKAPSCRICASSSAIHASARSSGCRPSTSAASDDEKSCPASAAQRASFSGSGARRVRRCWIRRCTLSARGHDRAAPGPVAGVRAASPRAAIAAFSVSSKNIGLPPVRWCSAWACARPPMPSMASESSKAAMASVPSGCSGSVSVVVEAACASTSARTAGGPSSGRIAMIHAHGVLPSSACSRSTLAASAYCRSSMATARRPRCAAASSSDCVALSRGAR